MSEKADIVLKSMFYLQATLKKWWMYLKLQERYFFPNELFLPMSFNFDITKELDSLRISIQ